MFLGTFSVLNEHFLKEMFPASSEVSFWGQDLEETTAHAALAGLGLIPCSCTPYEIIQARQPTLSEPHCANL